MAKAKKKSKPVPSKKTPVKKSAPEKAAPAKVAAKKAPPKQTSGKTTSAKKPPIKTVSKAPAKAAPKTVVKKAVAAPAPAVKKSSSTLAKMANKIVSMVKGATATKDLTNFVSPLDDRVIVRLTEAERVTAGGLFIPDTVADVSGNLGGTVMAVGRGHADKKGRVRPMDVKPGDKVLFGEYAGTKIRLMDEDFMILREGDLTGVLA